MKGRTWTTPSKSKTSNYFSGAEVKEKGNKNEPYVTSGEKKHEKSPQHHNRRRPHASKVTPMPSQNGYEDAPT